jgi:microcystin-dependent protein
MTEPFLGEVRLLSFNFAPKGWALCNGQLLPINQNQALFSLLGTTFGGNGQTTFALPNLQGRTPIEVGNGYFLGQSGGEQTHTLSVAELPGHTHTLNATSANPTATVPAGTLGYARSGTLMYGAAANLVAMSAQAVGNAGGSQPHLNMQPFLTLNFCIALQGTFPSPN